MIGRGARRHSARPAALDVSKLLPGDVLAVAGIGLRTRRLCAALSAVGVAIGIASMVAVLGISASSQAYLIATIDRLGTNLLTLQAGESFFGDESRLPKTARARVGAIDGVKRTASVYAVPGATVRRNDLVDPADTSGIAVQAADRDLPRALSAQLRSERFLSAATERFPTVVLGAIAAQRLGLGSVDAQPQVWIADRWWTVVGILRPVTLDSGIDRSALVGLPIATRLFGIDANPQTIYLRADPSRRRTVRDVVVGAANPEHPEEVEVSRPSDALEPRAAAKGAFTSPLLGAAGGVAGALLGAIVTGVYAAGSGLPAVVPPEAVAGGVLAALLIGAIAGLYPSMRAARLSPTEALRAV